MQRRKTSDAMPPRRSLRAASQTKYKRDIEKSEHTRITHKEGTPSTSCVLPSRHVVDDRSRMLKNLISLKPFPKFLKRNWSNPTRTCWKTILSSGTVPRSLRNWPGIPVRLYLREIGEVKLLDSDSEFRLATLIQADRQLGTFRQRPVRKGTSPVVGGYHSLLC